MLCANWQLNMIFNGRLRPQLTCRLKSTKLCWHCCCCLSCWVSANDFLKLDTCRRLPHSQAHFHIKWTACQPISQCPLPPTTRLRLAARQRVGLHVNNLRLRLRYANVGSHRLVFAFYRRRKIHSSFFQIFVRVCPRQSLCSSSVAHIAAFGGNFVCVVSIFQYCAASCGSWDRKKVILCCPLSMSCSHNNNNKHIWTLCQGIMLCLPCSAAHSSRCMHSTGRIY